MNNEQTISIILALAVLAAWLNHIIFCFTVSAWGFLIAGAICPPIGVIHGIWLWFR